MVPPAVLLPWVVLPLLGVQGGGGSKQEGKGEGGLRVGVGCTGSWRPGWWRGSPAGGAGTARSFPGQLRGTANAYCVI